MHSEYVLPRICVLYRGVSFLESVNVLPGRPISVRQSFVALTGDKY